MPLVTSEKMLLDAKKDGYAVGAFNVENMEMVKAVIAAAEELNAPVMLQTTPSTVKYGTLETFAGIVKAEAAKTKIPVCLHLDHGNSFELAVQAMKAGYTSVMIDGSHEDFENNIAVTKKVVDVANAFGIPVEAELGKVGGKEDDLEADADTNTDPQEAKEFVERTGVSSLAVAIGTAHGFYVGTPVLDKPRVSAIKEVVDVPLVLHGASGLSEEDVRECVERGMCKVNFATELRVAYTDAVKKLLEEKPELKEELDGLLSVYEISIRQNGEPVEIKDSAMTVRIPMNSHLEGYAHYQAVRVDGEPERIEAKAEDGSLVFEAGGPGRYAVLGSDTPFSVSAIIQPDPLPGDEKDGNAVYIVLLAAIPAAVLLALLLVFLYRKKRKAQDNPPAGGKDPSEPDGGNTKN